MGPKSSPLKGTMMGSKHSGWARTYSGARANSSAPRSKTRSAKQAEPVGYTSEDYRRLFAMTDNGLPIEAFLETLSPEEVTASE